MIPSINHRKRSDEFFDETRILEGKPSNHAWDPGKETMFGFSARYHPLLAPKIISKSLTLADVKEYNYSAFYQQGLIGDIESDALAYVIYDAIFTGQHLVYGNVLQTKLNQMTTDGAIVNSEILTVDGDIGPSTIRVLNLLSIGQIGEMLRLLYARKAEIGGRIAQTIIRRQKAEGLEIKDLTNGMIYRTECRCEVAANFFLAA